MKAATDPPLKRQKRQVLLVDEQPILREGFAQLIDRESDLKASGQADTAAKAVNEISTRRPDLVVLDIALQGMNGIELIKKIKSLHPALPILVLSALDEALFAERALRAGAKGYIMKQAPTDEVMSAVRRVIRGGRYLSRRMQERMLENLSNGSPGGSGPGIESLSDRELEVLRLVAAGLANAEIAEQLFLAVGTVKRHVFNLYGKLGANSRTSAVARARELGLL